MSKGLLIVVESDDQKLKERIANLLAVKMNVSNGSVQRTDTHTDAYGDALPFLDHKLATTTDTDGLPFMQAAREVRTREKAREAICATLCSGTSIVVSQYTPSTMLRFAVQCAGEHNMKAFMEWLYTYEHEGCEIPRPTIVFYLDTQPEYGTEEAEMRNVARLAHKLYDWTWINSPTGRDDGSMVEELCSHVSEVLTKEVVT